MSDPTTAAGWGIQLSKLWLDVGMPFPIDAQQIALDVTKQRFGDPITMVRPHGIRGIDGMLSRRQSKGDWCISYDDQVTVQGRINFTISHELGHYLLHRTRKNDFRCGQFDVVDLEGRAHKAMEGEANRFASYLLMPASDFRGQIAGQAVDLEILGQCAARYGTSLTASALKYVELTSAAAMVAVIRDGFVCWSFPSSRASKQGCYLAPGWEVPAEVDLLERAPTRVRPGVWHPVHEAVQEAIVSDQFEFAIVLLHFPDAGAVQHDEEVTEDVADFMAARQRK